MDILFSDEFTDEIGEFIDNEFNDYAIKNKLVCDYDNFIFTCIDNDKIVGMITGHSYYREVVIDNLIVVDKFRGKGIGTMLLNKVEDYFKDKEYDNINLTSYEFQAPHFYEKHGYVIEYIRKDNNNSKLDKYYLVKYL